MFGLDYILLVFLTTDSNTSVFIETLKNNLNQVLPTNFFLFFFIFVGFLLVISIFVFLILPLLRDNDKLYAKYLYIRSQMEKIDLAYTNKKINFVEYLSLQFDYAKDFEHLINVLSKDEYFAPKLKNYKFSDNQNKEDYINQKKLDAITKKQIDNLYSILLPVSKFYKEQEIKMAILDEGFNNEIADIVVSKIKNTDIKFGTETPVKENKLPDFLNTLFLKTTKGSLKEVDYDSSKVTFKNVKHNKPKQINVIGANEEYMKLKPKKKPLSLFKSLFKKSKSPTPEDLNNISININKKLKN